MMMKKPCQTLYKESTQKRERKINKEQGPTLKHAKKAPKRQATRR
jgi:hypothetical protein